METLLYLTKANAYWLLFYACYWLLLRKHTFFQWNRFYLLGSLLIAFALPAIHFAEPITTIYVPETVYQKASISVAVIADKTPDANIHIWTWITGLYAVVMLSLAWRFISGIFRLLKIANRSERVDMGHYTLFMLPENADGKGGSSFSFFRWLFLSPHDYRHNPDAVIRHEYEHIRQWHTADIILIELLKICFWFNPIVWLYKRSIETVHEYLADQPVPNRNDYAAFLVTYAMHSPDIMIANHFFNSSLLKSRIQMIYKKRSSRWFLTYYALVLPLVACSVAISASRSPLQVINRLEAKAEQSIHVKGHVLDENNAPIADAFIIISGTTRGTSTDANGRFELKDVPNNSKLAISHIAYEPFEITVIDDGTTAFDVIMRRAANRITGPVIVGRRVLADVGAKSASAQPSSNTYMKVVEQQPEFPGGKEALMSYLLENLKYPENARRQNLEAVALVAFSVDKNGEIRNARNLKQIGYGIDAEALRVVNEMPHWNPGVQNGKTVEVEYTLEINFKLEENKDKRQGALNFNIKGATIPSDVNKIGTFVTRVSNLPAFKQFTDVAYGGEWSVIPRMRTIEDTTHQQISKYRYLNYSDADLTIEKAPKKYRKVD